MSKKAAPTAAQKAEREAQKAASKSDTALVLVNGRKRKFMSAAKYAEFLAAQGKAAA